MTGQFERLCAAGLGLLLLAVGLLIEASGAPLGIFMALAVGYSAYTLRQLVKSRRFLLMTPFLFLFYGVAIVWLLNFVFGLPMSSWREGWEARSAFRYALKDAFCYLTFAAVAMNAALAALRPVAPLGSIRAPVQWWVPILALTLISGAALLATAGLQSRDNFAASADVGASFFLQSSAILLTVLFAYALFALPKGLAARNQILAIQWLVAVAVAANGFRFILVTFVFIAALRVLARGRLQPRTVGITAIAGLLGYVLLLIIAYTRSEEMTFLTALGAIFTLSIDMEEVFIFAGAADQINIIAISFFQDRSDLLSGATYLDAFLRLFPNAVHTAFFETTRSQDFIVNTGDFIPDFFRERNLNIGSHLFVEAIINFGALGPYLMLTIFVTILALIERVSRASIPAYVAYIALASLGYALAWYGFGNFLKQGAFAVASAYLVWLACRAAQPMRLRRPVVTNRS